MRPFARRRVPPAVRFWRSCARWAVLALAALILTGIALARFG